MSICIQSFAILCDYVHETEGSSNRVYFVGFDLGGFWKDVRIWKEVYVLYIYIFVNKFKDI